MHKAIKVRIYPDESQKILMDKTFGCCRVVYNYLLEEHIDFYEKKIKKGKATWKNPKTTGELFDNIMLYCKQNKFHGKHSKTHRIIIIELPEGIIMIYLIPNLIDNRINMYIRHKVFIGEN